MRDLPARPAASRLVRLLVALTVATALAWVPIASVDACSCVGWSFPESIVEADVAFTGTVSDVGGAEFGVAGWEPTQVTFDVTRSKDAMATPVVVDSILGSSASCGLDMAVGQEWLVLAHLDDGGRPQTNLCSGSTVLAALDGPTLAVVTDALVGMPVPADADASDGGWVWDLSHPVLLAVGAALVILVVSLLAFRKPRPE